MSGQEILDTSPRAMRTAPKDGRLVLLFMEGGSVTARAAYWHQCSRTKWWRSPSGGWVNDAIGWAPFPTAQDEAL